MKEAEKPLSKAEKKQKRREENRQWMARNKGGWSDDDPNPRHSQYYRIQLPELEGEWKQFVDAMRMDLKSTFRISETCNPFLASLLRSALEANKRPRGQFIAVKGEAFHGPVFREVPWCDATYELAVDGSSLASERGLRKLNQLLVREVAMGHLVRQELVSMIPASLIDIHRDHAVLDICAAPGSKTEQLLGMMAASNGYGHSAGKVSTCPLSFRAEYRTLSPLPPRGQLIRAIASAHSVLLLYVRACRGYWWQMTSIRSESEPSSSACTVAPVRSSSSPMAMQPCGAATSNAPTRKSSIEFSATCPARAMAHFANAPIFGDSFGEALHSSLSSCFAVSSCKLYLSGRPRLGLEFHEVQVSILMESIRLLKPGGLLAYSTCSLNPLEDEAVLAAALRRYPDHLE